MSCHVCTRPPNSRLPFHCSTCARTQLYQLRIENAGILLEKEALGKQIESAVTQENLREGLRQPDKDFLGHDGINDDTSRRWAIQTIANKRAESSARIKSIKAQIEVLRSKTKDKQLEISQRKLTLARRRSDAESAKYQLADREAAMLAGIQNNIKRTDHLWHSQHSKTAEARIFLCREAANLYGLHQKIRKTDDGVKESYLIGSVPILDLRDMNGKLLMSSCATPAQISTSFSNIAHLLILVSHYLSLRLPAEITLPHRNHATATIYTPAGSYASRETETQSSSHHPTSQSPTASRTADTRSALPRPRPLCLDKSLLKLAREDPVAYGFFLEGATLLAWNVSWLCRTQGLNLTSDTWEDVCNIGKNMWQLLVAPPAQASNLMRAFAGRDMQSKMKAAKDSPRTTIQRTRSFPMLGHYSHGTVHSFLGSAEGMEFMRTWRLPTPTKIVDKVKATLLGEMASAEWELLEKDWDDGSQEGLLSVGEPSVTQDIAAEKRKSNPATSKTTGAAEHDSRFGSDTTSEQSGAGRSKGTSGWTKLRSR